MKNNFSIIGLILFITALQLNLKAQKSSNNLNLIPQPSNIEQLEGYFTFTRNTNLWSNDISQLKNEIDYLRNYFQHLNSPLILKDNDATKYGISLILIDGDAESEAYELEIDENQIVLQANSKKGIFYGIQTLLQLAGADIYRRFDPNINEYKKRIQCLKIKDKPRFPWRGLLLDCSRHCMDVEFVKKYIDLLAYHKMNTLHWHIIDDQGWRIQIDKYPKLTEIGAWRKDVYDESEGDLYGCYYTKEEIKEIVNYGINRHVNIVPEIEMPGHCQSALAAYPEFSCNGGDIKVETEWGVFKEIYCAGNPNTYKFLEDVLVEVLEMFPSKYIHIGGDEVPKFRWEHCDKCQKTISTQNLKNEEGLQSHFLSKINEFLKKNDRTMIGWDEIAEGGLPSNSIVQSWRGFEGAEHALENEHFTIVSPTSHAYFDYDLKAIDLEKVYSFDPIPKSIQNDKKHLVLGGECNMWSERAPQNTVDSKVFPRLLAMSEILWTYPSKRDFSEFLSRVEQHNFRLYHMSVNYGFHKPPLEIIQSQKNNIYQVEFNALAGLNVYYQTNNKEKLLYTNPISLNKTSTIKAYYVNDNKSIFDKSKFTVQDTLVINYNHHQGINSAYLLDKKYNDSYKGSGDSTLTNGFRGSTDFRDGNWQGFFGDDLIANFDFTATPQTLTSVKVGCLQYNNSWIFLPQKINVEYSNDGVNFELLACSRPALSPKERGRHLQTINIEFPEQEIKYLRVTAENLGECPHWHDAAGSKAWLFVDEIILE